MVKRSENRSKPKILKLAKSTTMANFPIYYFPKHSYRLYRFFFFFFPSYFMFIYNFVGYDRSEHFYIQESSPAWRPLFVHFYAILPCLIRNIWDVFPLLSLAFLTYSPSNFSPVQSFFCFYSISLFFAPSLPPTLDNFRNSNNRPIAFSLASNSASSFILVQPC